MPILIATIITIILELIGVWRHKAGKTDTITEWFRKLRDSMGEPWRFIFMLAVTTGLVWLIFHAWDLA